MDNELSHMNWRSNEVKTTEEEKQLPLEDYDLLRVERKFIEVITNFVKGIFNYEKIEISLIKKETQENNESGYSFGSLESENDHSKYQFVAKLFNDRFYEFTVKNIPAIKSSRHIQIFFRVLMQYLNYFYMGIQSEFPLVGTLEASQTFLAKSDIWLYNIERTIIIEYIYNLFNTLHEGHTNEFKWAPKPIRYNLDLISKILDFSNELSTKKVENKEIYCGFVFHDKENVFYPNSVRSIKFKKRFSFGDFGLLKNYLEVSNGQNIFFNVKKGKITHLFITRENFNENYFNPNNLSKPFKNSPLVLSIRGTGKIYFLEGTSDLNRITLQIINSKPIIRDNTFIKQFISSVLKKFAIVQEEQLEVFSKWVMSLSQKKRGTSLLFKKVTKKIEKKLVKTVAISFEDSSFLGNENLRYDLSLLDSMVKPDGAVFFGQDLIPSHISTILPIGSTPFRTSGGARHNATANFTKEFKCIGIVISEDGPTTLFRNGKKLIKF